MRSDSRTYTLIWAGGLALFGVVLLLFNFELLSRFEPVAQYVLAGIFGLLGAGMLVLAVAAPENWPRLIPGWTLVALAAMILAGTLPMFNPRMVAALLFLGLALAFTHIYLLNQAERWWAVIPGGFMLVLGATIALSARIERAETLGTILFAGMGLVFFVLYFLPGKQRQWWALIPGSVLLVFGFFVFTLDSQEVGALRWWPLLLIVLGGIIGFMAYRRQPQERMQIHAAPTPKDAPPTRAQLGEYTQPAPGTTVEILSDDNSSS